MGSVTKTDIVIAIRPQHVANIATRTKDHEFRKYLIPPKVSRIWIYETSPTSAIKYVATISRGKKPGEIGNEAGLRNKEFNDGKLSPHLANYAYEILDLKRLDEAVLLSDLVSKGWLGGPPQKYCYIKDNMMRGLRRISTTCIIPSTARHVNHSDKHKEQTIQTTLPPALQMTKETPLEA